MKTADKAQAIRDSINELGHGDVPPPLREKREPQARTATLRICRRKPRVWAVPGFGPMGDDGLFEFMRGERGG